MNKSDILGYLSKLQEFNKYELELQKESLPQENIQKFIALYDFSFTITSKERIAANQEEHLNSLIDCQKKFKQISERLA